MLKRGKGVCRTPRLNARQFEKLVVGVIQESELTERRAFIQSFVKEIVVGPGEAKLRYTIPMPQESHLAGMDAEDVTIPEPVLSKVNGGSA